MHPDHRSIWARGLLLWALALLVPFGGMLWICPDGLCTVPPVDAAVLAAMNTLRGPAGDALASGWTWLGSIYVLAPLLLGLAILLVRRGRADEAMFVFAAMAGAVALCQTFKYWVLRPRPGLHELVGHLPADPSFPSAHSMQAAAGLLILALLAPAGWRGPALVLAIAGACGVALTRLYLQVHFPSDVVVGLLAGWLWVLGCRTLLLQRTHLPELG